MTIPPQFETVLSALRFHAKTQPGRIAYTFLKSDNERHAVTYQQLETHARRIAQELLRHAQPGDRALMAYAPGLEFIEAFLGCLYAGIVAVPAFPPKKNRNAERVLAIAQDCQPTLLLCTRETQPSLTGDFAAAVPDARILATDECPEPNETALPEVMTADLAFLQYTSGSTRSPTGVMISHRNMVANEQLIANHFGFSQQSIVVSWLPMFHDMGLIGGILAPLYVGFPSILMAPNVFLREPVKWLQAVTEFKATTTGAPNFAYDLCVKRITPQQKASLDLSSLVVAYNGAEPVRAETLERFSEAFETCGFRKDAFFPCYGMAETTLLVSGGPPMTPTAIVELDPIAQEKHRLVESPGGQRIVSCGYVGREMDVRIVHPDTFVACSPQEIGEIWLRGDSVADGYLNRPDVTDATFRARLNGDDRPWLRTGDYGFLRNGELYVTGRLKDLIIVRGRNIYPQDIERLAEQHLAFIEPNAAAAFSIEDANESRLVLVIEANRDMVRWSRNVASHQSEISTLGEAIESLRAAVIDQFEVVLNDIVFVRPTTFPRTSSGKVQRRLCRKLHIAGSLETVLEGQFSSVREERETAAASVSAEVDQVQAQAVHTNLVNSVMAALTDWAHAEKKSLPALTELTTFSQLEIDSLAAADIGFRLEQRVGVRVEADALYHQRTVGELAQFLLRMVKASECNGQPSQTLPMSRRDHPEQFIEQPRMVSDKSQKDVQAGTVNVHKMDWNEHFKVRSVPFEAMKKAGTYYYDTEIESCDGAWVSVGGRKLLMLASYNYLGFISDPRIGEAARRAIDAYGIGQHGSRLISGTTSDHKALERELAEFMQAEDSIVFNSGYVTNLATVAALVGPDDVVLGDEFNHASLVDGCKMSGGTFRTFRHNDLASLEQLLVSFQGRRVLVAVDAVFSMEGDIAPLPEIVALCRRYGALLMVDEAHSLGTMGRTGRGMLEHFDLAADSVDVKMGTLSKSLGGCGGFVAGSRTLISYLRHNARGYVFSVATPNVQIATVREALRLLHAEPERVEQLQSVSSQFRTALQTAGFRVYGDGTPIVPIACNTDEVAFEFTKCCRSYGLFVVPIVYPAVPMNAPRVRTNLTSLHTEVDIQLAVELLTRAAIDTGLIKLNADAIPVMATGEGFLAPHAL